LVWIFGLSKVLNMKVLLLSVMFFVFGCFTLAFGQSKDYFFSYKFTYIKDTVDRTYSNPLYFVLYNSGQDSKFHIYGEYLMDSINYALFGDMDLKKMTAEMYEKYKKDPNHARISLSFGLMIGKDFKKKQMYTSISNVEASWQCMSSLDVKWNYEGERDTLYGLEVYKATTFMGGRTWEVWYTPSIPISDGPYKFHGTPGLIVKGQDTEKRFIFEYYKSRSNPKLYYNKRYKEIGATKDCEALKKFMHDFQKNPRYSNIIGDTGEMNNAMKNSNKYKLCYLIEK
jgi:GLPGLI family protein